MATIEQQLQITLDTKAAIKTAIEGKGVDMTGVKFTEFPTKINEISGGGGSEDLTWKPNPLWWDIAAAIEDPKYQISGYTKMCALLYIVKKGETINISIDSTYRKRAITPDGTIITATTTYTPKDDELKLFIENNNADAYYTTFVIYANDVDLRVSGTVMGVNKLLHVCYKNCIFVWNDFYNNVSTNTSRYLQHIQILGSDVELTVSNNAAIFQYLYALESFSDNIIFKTNTATRWFINCIRLKKLPRIILSRGYVDSMCKNCYSLVDATGLEYVSTATDTTQDYLSSMFYNCFNLKYLRPNNKFYYRGTSSASEMFYNCFSIEDIPWDITFSASTMGSSYNYNANSFFYNCVNLKNIKKVYLYNSNNSISSNFTNVNSLENADIRGYVYTNYTLYFSTCKNLSVDTIIITCKQLRTGASGSKPTLTIGDNILRMSLAQIADATSTGTILAQ